MISQLGEKKTYPISYKHSTPHFLPIFPPEDFLIVGLRVAKLVVITDPLFSSHPTPYPLAYLMGSMFEIDLESYHFSSLPQLLPQSKPP